jgi:hypothetical protein
MAARLLAARTHGSRRAGSELGTMPYVCGLDGFISFFVVVVVVVVECTEYFKL